MTDGSRDTTQLLKDWSAGDGDALKELMDRVYLELRVMAGAQMRDERGDHTLQPTALVHEAFLRLVRQNRTDWRSRAQFFDVASRMMRRVLVDHARRRRRVKRGGLAVRVELTPASGRVDTHCEDVLALDEALRRLRELDRRQSRIAELHFFAGLSVSETAEVLGCSEATVSRDRRMARMWLARELGRGKGRGA